MRIFFRFWHFKDFINTSKSQYIDNPVTKIIGSWKENEVTGFVVFSQKLLRGYFRLSKVRWLPRRVRQMAPQGYSPPLGLEIGEKLLWKYDKTLYFVFFQWSKISLFLLSSIVSIHSCSLSSLLVHLVPPQSKIVLKDRFSRILKWKVIRLKTVLWDPRGRRPRLSKLVLVSWFLFLNSKKLVSYSLLYMFFISMDERF